MNLRIQFFKSRTVRRMERISMLIDVEPETERRRMLEELKSTDPALAAEAERMLAVRELLAAKAPAPPTVGFWTRLSAELDSRETEQDNLLPIPRRLVPAFGALSFVTMFVLGFLVYQNGDSVLTYLNLKKTQLEDVYNKGVLQGTLKPLLAGIDRDGALNFALFGVLPLDKKSSTALRVDESSNDDCRIKFTRNDEKKLQKTTLVEFYEQIDATEKQKEVLDSLLNLACNEIETSVLVSDKNEVAVAPSIARLNRVLLASMAASLTMPQRTKLAAFMEGKNAPYALSHDVRPLPPERLYSQVMLAPHSENMIVVTPETLMCGPVELNIDSLRREARKTALAMKAEQAAVVQEAEEARREALFRSFPRSVGVPVAVRTDAASPVRISGSGDHFSIHIETSWSGLPNDSLVVWVQPKTPHTSVTSSYSIRLPRRAGGQSVRNFYEWERDSTGRSPRGVWVLPDGDTARSMESFVIKYQRLHHQQMDSIMQAFRQQQIQLDSLFRVFPEYQLNERIEKFQKRKVKKEQDI